MSTALQNLLGTAFIIGIVTLSLQLTGCAVLEKLPPAPAYTPDAQDGCLEQHVWGETVLGSSGPSLSGCASISGWSQEHKAQGGDQ